MRYCDLVNFEPIETVIQLRDADEQKAAHRLVKTYVISDRMADQLINLVIPQLQFQTPIDNKGVLIVGNYGTGKSHLMSVISAVAEHADLLALVNHSRVQETAKGIAGKFKVLRVEIGGVTGSLRDILLAELERALEKWKTPYRFPPADQVTNNKNSIIEAVAVFQKKCPDYGILLVVDELLDFLRTREERALIMDLGFLRELGEVAASTSFRFIGGLQETLFDSPRFTFVAEQLRRVRDRFEQVRIAREDIAFVVSHRLLRKTDKQLAQITDHLRQFTLLYKQMAERLEEFAQLFPIHPAYIATFEQVAIAEKREVLKTFSLAMRQLMDEEVPEDQPGLVSYDHYWAVLRENPSLRGMPGIADVIEKSGVLEGRIRNAYTREVLQPVALRIISALSVHRLTTSDVFVPLGVTAEELRDNLCLFVRTPEASADFLLDQVQVSLREIMRTVQGQFLSFNEENGQYYLDLKKVIDFDAKVGERGDFMERSDLNRYFFDALRQAFTSLPDTTYVTNYNIWFYELPWNGHKVTRPGYLFFGAPDERSTAQPPRDFYVYWLPPFLDRKYHDEHKSDEVILELAGLAEDFERRVRLYAGARSLSIESSEYRQEYANKADESLRILLRWLREHLTEHLQVIYQGVKEPVSAILSKMHSTASQSIEDLIRLVASHLLTPDFEERYPEYPSFSRATQTISDASRTASTTDAIYCLGGRSRTNLAMVVLEGLELVDAEGTVRPYESRYAQKFLDVLQKKPEGQVVNRGELIEQVAVGITPVEKDVYFHLEPEWVVVILLALVHHGDIVLNVGREELDASTLERALTLAVPDLTNFRFYKRPRSLPLPLWTTIFEGLSIQSGLIRDENTRDQAVRELQRVVNAEMERVAMLESRIQSGLQLWNASIFTDRYTLTVEGGTVVASDLPAVTLSSAEILPCLRGYKGLLSELSKFNAEGKLRNLRLGASEVKDTLDDRKKVQRAEKLVELVTQMQALTTYLVEARANLPDDYPWSQRADTLKQNVIDDLRRFGKGEKEIKSSAMLRDLEELKAGYISAYIELHRKLVLGSTGDDKRKRLYSDARLKALDQLTGIDLLRSAGASELETWKRSVSSLPSCREFHDGMLTDSPTCRSCQLRPVQRDLSLSADQLLSQLDDRLDDMLTRWRLALRSNLTSEGAQRSFQAMSPVERKPIEAFLIQKDDDPRLPNGFTASASQALHGIESITVFLDDLLHAFKAGGLPCTVDELRHRFSTYLDKLMRGHDESNTRLNLDK